MAHKCYASLLPNYILTQSRKIIPMALVLGRGWPSVLSLQGSEPHSPDPHTPCARGFTVLRSACSQELSKLGSFPNPKCCILDKVNRPALVLGTRLSLWVKPNFYMARLSWR